MTQPIKGVAYEFPPVELTDVFDPQFFLVNPTIEAGDFQISKDFGTLANLATLPVVDPPGSSSVKINLSATEMNADKIGVFGKDPTEEWGDINMRIDVPESDSQSAVDILEGDRIESSVNYKIFKKGTTDILVDKDITGSLLRSDITITTLEP